MKKRKTFWIVGGALFIFLSLFASSPWAAEEKYPTRQIELILNFPPGGPLDTGARIIHPALQKEMGVPILLTTKGGAGGALGADYVAKAKPDGYTVLATNNGALTIAPQINAQITYKYQDFTPVCTFVADPAVITSKAKAPWKNLDELVDYAKKNPGKLNYGTPGMGTVAFFTMELFKMAYGLDIVAVHFQGTGPAKNAILGGHVDLASSGFGSLAPLIKSGDIIPLVTTASKRVVAFPDVPTMAEKGFPDATLNIWFGLLVPQECPPQVASRLGAAMSKVMRDPAIISQLEKSGLIVDYRDREATLKLLTQEYTTLTKVIQKTGIGK
jgi:tripartite-type tricarboxylate transporter receptor subunit TctC